MKSVWKSNLVTSEWSYMFTVKCCFSFVPTTVQCFFHNLVNSVIKIALKTTVQLWQIWMVTLSNVIQYISLITSVHSLFWTPGK